MKDNNDKKESSPKIDERTSPSPRLKVKTSLRGGDGGGLDTNGSYYP